MRKPVRERVQIGEVDTIHDGIRHGQSVGGSKNAGMHPGPQDVIGAAAALSVMRAVADDDPRWSAVALLTG